MKKILKYIILFFFFFSFLFPFISKSSAACTDSSATCSKNCPSNTTVGSGTCKDQKTGDPGSCCVPNSNSGNSGASTNSYSWGSWGNTPAGTSLFEVKNFFGSSAPANATKATWQVILSTVISLLILASIVLALAYLILGGFNWIFSGGDKQKLAQSRERVIMAIVGLIIVFVAMFVITVIGKFFSIDFLNLP